MKQNPLELYKEIAKVGAIMKEIKEMIKGDINAQGRDKSVSELLKSMSDLIDKGYLNSLPKKKEFLIPSIIIGLCILVSASIFISYDTKKVEIKHAERIATLEEKVGLLEDHDLLLEKAKDNAYNKAMGGE